MPIDENVLRRDVANAVNDWMGIQLTDAQIDEILAEESLGSDCRRWGVDTVVREHIAQFLAKKITGRPWPIGNTPKEEAEEFFTLYEANAEAKGYTLIKGKQT